MLNKRRGKKKKSLNREKRGIKDWRERKIDDISKDFVATKKKWNLKLAGRLELSEKDFASSSSSSFYRFVSRSEGSRTSMYLCMALDDEE